jgi:hypothetical protein
MKLATLLKKHSIHLTDSTLKICEEGVNRMGKSIDPHHDRSHVARLFNHLSYLISSDKQLRKIINFNVLLPAICWHDVWISRQNAQSLSKLVLNNIVEGLLSAKLFYSYAHTYIQHPQLMQIYYVIKKHSSVQLFPLRTLEAKVLADLDKLELWNNKRFLNKSNTYVSNRYVYQKYIVRLYFYYSHKMGMYFKELEKELKKFSNEFWKEVGEKNNTRIRD